VIVNFLIIAFILFQLVKISNRMKKEQPATPPAPTTTEKLLIEIRDQIAAQGIKK
jgi:large conductance mechanosensitive channel